jgi:hypothetical protein
MQAAGRAAFGLAWPVAVAMAEWGRQKAGFIVETADKRALGMS